MHPKEMLDESYLRLNKFPQQNFITTSFVPKEVKPYFKDELLHVNLDCKVKFLSEKTVQ